ncbi:MAG: hypothetical protein QM733_13225 [Ilumatobacteraceae bacterium]
MEVTYVEAMAGWVEHRLHECVCAGAPRLYGLEVLDAACFADVDGCHGPAARLSFVGEAADASALVLGAPCAAAVGGFDAVVLVTTRWEPAAVPLPRPGGHPVRRRARVVTVVGDAGTASAVRFDHEPERVLVVRGLACAGIAGVQLAAMWSARAA